MSFSFDSATFQIQNPSSMLWFGSAELFANFFGVVGMDLGVQAGSVPVALRVI